MHKAVKVVISIVSSPILLWFTLVGASHVYVSGGAAAGMFNNNPIWDIIIKLDQPWLPTPGEIRVECVSFLHAFLNGLFLVSSVALLALLVPLSIILGIIATIYGLFTANWDFLGGGILIIIIFPLLATLAVIVGSFAMWLGLLFQPCTPAYAIIWFILGIPFAIIGASIGLAQLPQFQ